MFDLLENIIQVFDTFILRCPREVVPHLGAIQASALVFVKYDPYMADDSEDEDEDEDEDDEDDDEDSEEEDDDDDDDASYKVRRAGAKCIKSLINSRSDLINTFYAEVADVLINRLQERLEPVKLEIFAAITGLIRQTAMVNKVRPGDGPTRRSESIEALTALAPKLVKKLAKTLSLKGKTGKSKIAAFKVLSEVVTTIPGVLTNELIGKIVPGVIRVVKDKGAAATLKLEALQFVTIAIECHPLVAFQPHVGTILEVLLSPAGVGDSYFKVSAQSLRVVSRLITVISEDGYNAAPHMQSIYSVVFERFTQQDVDQEVKECAIQCMGNMIARQGGSIDVAAALPVLQDRLNNETTRLPAVKALGECLQVDISSIMGPSMAHLLDFLRKKHSGLRQATLVTLTGLVASPNKSSIANTDELVSMLEPLLEDLSLTLTIPKPQPGPRCNL